MSIVKRYQNHLRISADILKNRPKGKPFHIYLKTVFKEHKKFGSKDRKSLKELCYGYFRIGHLLPLDLPEALMAWTYIQGEVQQEILDFSARELGLVNHNKREERIDEILNTFNLRIEDLYLWQCAISDRLDKNAYSRQFWNKPKMWLRALKKFQQPVAAYLTENGFAVESPFQGCLGIKENLVLQQHRFVETRTEVQDRSSQWVVQSFADRINGPVWDACAASGGKALALKDCRPDLRIVASDKREGSLRNLSLRAKKNGLRFESGRVDLSKELKEFKIGDQVFGGQFFQTIWLDVPCTGSGTWPRNPESALDLKLDKIDKYVKMQRDIVRNALPFLAQEGLLLYTTCSVFEAENEGQLEYFKTFGLHVLEIGYVQGYQNDCDSMFYLLLRK
jgi:16S rRNA (cytosine967-C5)-methyltransferase